MLELLNETAWRAGLFPGWDRERQFQFTLVVKMGYRFDLDGGLEPLRPPAAIATADRHHGDPRASSLAEATEIAPFKQGAEVLLTGTAHPPLADAVVMETEIGLRRRDGASWNKVLRVFGPRVWRGTLLGTMPSFPETLQPTPLRYEYAFGGVDVKRRALEPRNPVGLGFARHGRVAKGQALPRIEQGPRFITRPGNRPTPAGYGPLAPAWPPRNAAAPADPGTPENDACPYGPEVPDALHNCAPLDQRFPHPFTGDETVMLRGFFAERPAPRQLALSLPGPRPAASLVVAGKHQPLALACDTLLIDTDSRHIHLLWRGTAAWRPGDTRRGWVVLRESPRQAETAPEHGGEAAA